jgi:hypothetical protein
MPDSDAYRKRAEECRERAEKTTDPNIKRQYEEMAQGWMALARSAEQRGL